MAIPCFHRSTMVDDCDASDECERAAAMVGTEVGCALVGTEPRAHALAEVVAVLPSRRRCWHRRWWCSPPPPLEWRPWRRRRPHRRRVVAVVVVFVVAAAAAAAAVEAKAPLN
jgi:hypothetical protein